MVITEENNIVERILAGERELYAVLVDRYKTPIFNLAFRMTASCEDADDLAQETFVRAFNKLRLFDKEKSFFTWLYTIGLNVIRNHLAKKTKDSLTASDRVDDGKYLLNAADCSLDPEQFTADNQLRELLEFCLLKLTLDLREALALRFYQGLSFEDMAEITGCSVSAMKMRVYRGIEELQRLMSADFL